MIKNPKLFIRKTHRYLGLFIGIQFLGWTISGLYFSWNDIDSVHGDHLRKTPHYLKADAALVSPAEVIKNLRAVKPVDSLHFIRLMNIVNQPVYQVAYFSGHVGEGMHLHTHYALADASTGQLRAALSREEAIALAKDHVVENAMLGEVKYLEQTDPHHEYRERPLPTWAVSFDDPDCTVYLSAEMGTFQTIRHDQWRAFDFLWMLHTMDYEARDDINNFVLRIFSIFGLVTVVSGFVLFITSSRTLKKITN